jgi:hypothetical protein
MRRLILGAVALITGLLAAGGIAMARRRGDRDEILELDPAPPLGAGESGATTDASVEADFGPVGEPAGAVETPPEPKKRKPRVRRKPAKTAAAAAGADGVSLTTDETTDAERNAESAAKAEAAASAEAAAIAGTTEGADAPVAS